MKTVVSWLLCGWEGGGGEITTDQTLKTLHQKKFICGSFILSMGIVILSRWFEFSLKEVKGHVASSVIKTLNHVNWFC